MTFSDLLNLLGGLALFLYGMHMMSVGLEEIAGADDYIGGKFTSKVLIARINAKLNRIKN